MASSVSAIIRGFDYQANFAWIFICEMLMKHSLIEYIEYEADGKKSFDDIVIHYYHDKPKLGGDNNPIFTECYQVKFHVDYSNAMTISNLMDPEFIKAKKLSILNRLVAACKEAGDQLKYTRFFFTSSYAIDHKDVLSKLVSTMDGELRLHKIFDGSMQRSEMGQLRTQLIKHMGLSSEEELKKILSCFRIVQNTGTECMLVNQLNVYLHACKLKLIDISSNVNPYQQLIHVWTKKDKKRLTRQFVLEECTREGLLTSDVEDDHVPVGIRSFSRWAENMQAETETMLCLVEFFDDRFLKETFDWSMVCNKIQQYVLANLNKFSTYKLFLDTHLCISFYAGRCLNPKSGVCVYPIQKVFGQGSQEWEYSSQYIGEQFPDWVFEKTSVSSEDTDTVLIVSATLEISHSVEEYLEQTNIAYSYILKCSLLGKCSNTCIQGGDHAKALAESIIKELSTRTMQQKRGRIHIFMAVPVAFAFLLGQMSLGLGRATIYEYDYEGRCHATYYPTIEF